VPARAAITCVVAAVLVLGALAGAGQPRAGLAAAAGLALGSVNGLLAGRALGAGISPRLSGLIRLAVLSAAAIAIGVVIGLDDAWLVILGVGAAQMVLVGFAARSLLRR
jgi:hypothetical protein